MQAQCYTMPIQKGEYMKEEKTDNIVIRVEPSLHEALHEKCQELDDNVSRIGRSLFKTWLKKNNKKPLD